VSGRWVVKHIDEIEPSGGGWLPVRIDLGIRAFGINAWRPAADGSVIGEHDETHSGHEELYVVVDGHARFEVNGEQVDAPAGTFVFVRDPAAKRKATAEPGTTVLAVGAAPGKAFTPESWELAAPGLRAYGKGDYERARELFLEALEQHPGAAGLEYNAACMCALTGRREEALEHLRTAMAARPTLKPLDDDDFASLRDDPEFLAIAGASA
jgi:tetratricopeptide (TPR) repeat protein